MVRLLLVLSFCFSLSIYAQQVSGKIVDEDQNPLASVLIFNMKSEQKTYSNNAGEFTLAAIVTDELRFVRKGFERTSRIVNQQNLNSFFVIVLNRTTTEIEEVKIVYKPTGDLNQDVKNYGDPKPVVKLKAETINYIFSKSSLEVTAPKPGEFVQPKVSDVLNGAIDNQWDDVDFMQFLISDLGTDFFTDDLKLKKTEIQPLIFYVFKNFERKQILFRGICSPADRARFIMESYRKLDSYRKNLPNSPNKK